jgi:hypothetical protein
LAGATNVMPNVTAVAFADTVDATQTASWKPNSFRSPT